MIALLTIAFHALQFILLRGERPLVILYIVYNYLTKIRIKKPRKKGLRSAFPDLCKIRKRFNYRFLRNMTPALLTIFYLNTHS